MHGTNLDSSSGVAAVVKPADINDVTDLITRQNNVLREIYAELQLHRCDELSGSGGQECCHNISIPAARVRQLLRNITHVLRKPQPEIIKCLDDVIKFTTPAVTATDVAPDAASVHTATPAEADAGSSGDGRASCQTHPHNSISKDSPVRLQHAQRACHDDIADEDNHTTTDHEAYKPLSIVRSNDVEHEDERAATAPNNNSLGNDSSAFQGHCYSYKNTRVADPHTSVAVANPADANTIPVTHAHPVMNTNAPATPAPQTSRLHWFVHIQASPGSNPANISTEAPSAVYPAHDDRPMYVHNSASTSATAAASSELLRATAPTPNNWHNETGQRMGATETNSTRTNVEDMMRAACHYNVEQDVQRMVHANIQLSREHAKRNVHCQTGQGCCNHTCSNNDDKSGSTTSMSGSGRTGVTKSTPFIVRGESVWPLRCSVATQCDINAENSATQRNRASQVSLSSLDPQRTSASSAQNMLSSPIAVVVDSAANASSTARTMRSCVSQSPETSSTQVGNKERGGDTALARRSSSNNATNTPTRGGLCRRQGRSARRVRPEWDNNFALGNQHEDDANNRSSTPNPGNSSHATNTINSPTNCNYRNSGRPDVAHLDASRSNIMPNSDNSLHSDVNVCNEPASRARDGIVTASSSPRRSVCSTNMLHLRTAPARRCGLTYRGLDSRGIETALYGAPVVSNACVEQALLDDTESVKKYMAAEDATLRAQEQLHLSALHEQQQQQLQQRASQSRETSPTMSFVRGNSPQQMRRRLPSGALVPLGNSCICGNSNSSDDCTNFSNTTVSVKVGEHQDGRCTRTPLRVPLALTCTQRQLQAERSLLENQLDTMYQELIRSSRRNHDHGNEARYEQLNQRLARVQADLKRVSAELDTVTQMESNRARYMRMSQIQPFVPLSM